MGLDRPHGPGPLEIPDLNRCPSGTGHREHQEALVRTPSEVHRSHAVWAFEAGQLFARSGIPQVEEPGRYQYLSSIGAYEEARHVPRALKRELRGPSRRIPEIDPAVPHGGCRVEAPVGAEGADAPLSHVVFGAHQLAVPGIPDVQGAIEQTPVDGDHESPVRAESARLDPALVTSQSGHQPARLAKRGLFVKP